MTGLRGMYEDFAGYRSATENDLVDALRTATVVVDTNVLFSLYRYSNTTRTSLFDLLDKVGGRLFVPHQVMREFWRNRLQVVADRGQGHRDVLDQLDKHLRGAATALDKWAKAAAVDSAERDQLTADTPSRKSICRTSIPTAPAAGR